MTVASFAARLVPELEVLLEEQRGLRKLGVPYSEWRLMPAWKRQHIIASEVAEAQERAKAAQEGGIPAVISMVLSKLMT